MEIIRTDSSCETERLILLRQMCQYHKYDISKLEDHEGTLTVYWKSIPHFYDMENLERAWEFLHESAIEHVWE